MSYSLKSIENLIKNIEARQQKRKKKEHNKKIGYAPKCKVCNSEYLDEIENLREQNYTYEEILEELGITDISIMSLSRHFKNHYPKSQAYKEKQKIQMLENIREAYLKYPFLEDIFKNKELEDLEMFNKYCGFCTDRFEVCEFIPASTVSNCNGTIWRIIFDTTDEILNEKNNSYFGLDKNKENEIRLKYQNQINQCLVCKEEINEKRINLLEKIITYNFLNIAPENKELYFNLLEFDGTPEEFIETLQTGKEENQ